MGWKTGVLIVIALAAAFAWIAGASMIARTLSDIAETPWVVWAYLGSLLVLVVALYAIYRQRFQPKKKKRQPPIARTKRPVEEVLTDIDRRLTDPSEMEVAFSGEAAAAATISLCGAPGVGVSSIAGLLKGAFDPELIGEAGVLSTDADQNRRTLALARRASLPVFVVANDLRAHEFDAVKELAKHNPQTLIVLNKADTFAGDDKSRLLAVIAGRMEGIIQPDRIIAVSADPRPVRRVEADGAEREIAQNPDIQALVDLISAALKA